MKSLRSLKKVKPPTTARALAASVNMAAPVSVRELMTRLELAALPRAFYLICHRCNDLFHVRKAIKLGANAIECDVQFSDSANEFAINHDLAFMGVEIKPFLDGFAELLNENPQVALVIFDVKDDDADRAARLREIIRTHLSDRVPDLNVLISQADFASRGFFAPIKGGLKAREGYAIDQHDDPAAVSNFFIKELGVANHGFGDGVAVFGVETNIPRAIMEGVALKWSRRELRWVYVWTLREQYSMRDYIRVGVDGIMVNHEDVVNLKNIVNEPEMKKRVRLATRQENPFRPPFLPAYVLTVKTHGGVDKAGTDANLTFELRGSAGSVSTLLDASPVGLFEKGQTNRVTLIGTDVGAIQEVVLSQDGSGDGPDWFVETVHVQKSGEAGGPTFNFSQWIRPNRPARRTPAQVQYALVVTTKDESGAGTDADVKFVLKGTKGTIEKEFNGGANGRFESGKTDTEVIHGIDIGSLKSITLSHDGSGLGDAWLPARVSVKGGGVNANVDFNAWVEAGKPVTRNV